MSNSSRPSGGERLSCFRKHNLVETRFADLGPSKRNNGRRRLAYCKIDGNKGPGIVYIPGYFSKMYIAKANILEEFCLKNGYPFIKYDAEGIGESRVEGQHEVSFAEWYEDACHVLEHLTKGPQMLVSSSNGAWMSLLLATKYPELVHSILMLGPAVNHGLDDDLFETLMQSLDKETQAKVAAGEVVRFKANWGVEVTASKRFLQEMKEYRIDIEKPLEVRCPVRIIHSMEDDSVHWENCLDIIKALRHDDVRFYLKKRGDHRLMRNEDLHLQMLAVRELLENYPVQPADTAPPRQMTALPQNLMTNLLGEMGKRRSVADKRPSEAMSKL